MDYPETQPLPLGGIPTEYSSTKYPTIKFSFLFPSTDGQGLDERGDKDEALGIVAKKTLEERLERIRIEVSEQEPPAVKEDPLRPPTTPIYHHSPNLRSHSTRILSIVPFEELSEVERQLFNKQYVTHPTPLHCIITEETIFYPQSGGQPYDTGTMKKSESMFIVLQVRNTRDKCVLHLGEFSASSERFVVGEEIEQKIDEERRNLNSIYHTAGHILQDAVHQLDPELGVKDHEVLKAHLFPSGSYVEFKGLIASAHKELIQAKVDELLEQNLRVMTHWWDDEEFSKNNVMGLDRFESRDEKTRVTSIEGLSSFACCGTHVDRTGEVGKIVLCGFRRRHGKTSIGYKVELEK